MNTEEERKIDQDFFKSIEKEESGISLDDEENLDKIDNTITQKIVDDEQEETEDDEPEKKPEPKEEKTADIGTESADSTEKADATPKVDGEAGKEPAPTGQENTKTDSAEVKKD